MHEYQGLRRPCGDYVAWVGGENETAEIFFSGNSPFPSPAVERIGGDKEPKGIIKIIGRNFGDVQNDSVVRVGSKVFEPGHKRIKFWSDKLIRIKTPDYDCGKYNSEGFIKRKVWITIGSEMSNVVKFKLAKPKSCT